MFLALTQPKPKVPPPPPKPVVVSVATPAPLPTQPAPTAGSFSTPQITGDILDRIAKCESGNNPRAISPNGTYRGAWQFDLGTYHSNGGVGDPIDSSYAVQKSVAATLYAKRGGAPWPVCSRK